MLSLNLEKGAKLCKVCSAVCSWPQEQVNDDAGFNVRFMRALSLFCPVRSLTRTISRSLSLSLQEEVVVLLFFFFFFLLHYCPDDAPLLNVADTVDMTGWSP